MYCKNCGNNLENNVAFCGQCGTPIDEQNTSSVNNNNTAKPKETDSSNLGYALLGFFLPLVGLILFLIWKDEYPLRARSAGKGALISVIISFAAGVLLSIVGILVASSMPFIPSV